MYENNKLNDLENFMIGNLTVRKFMHTSSK